MFTGTLILLSISILVNVVFLKLSVKYAKGVIDQDKTIDFQIDALCKYRETIDKYRGLIDKQDKIIDQLREDSLNERSSTL